jgi:hypothetical protein
MSLVVEARKYPDGILVFVDYKINGMRKPFEFQSTDIFVTNPVKWACCQGCISLFESSYEIYRSIGAV